MTMHPDGSDLNLGVSGAGFVRRVAAVSAKQQHRALVYPNLNGNE
jgi:hypothetical protein